MYAEEPFLGLGVAVAGGIFFVTLVIATMIGYSLFKRQRPAAGTDAGLAATAPAQDAESAVGAAAAPVEVEASATRDAVPASAPGGSVPAAALGGAGERKLAEALAKTRVSLFGRIKSVFTGKSTLSESEREELEEILYMADLGPKTVQQLLDSVFAKLKATGETGFEAVRRELQTEIERIFSPFSFAPGAADGLDHLNLWTAKPAVLMVVGVNGAGKTTTIGKLAARMATRGKRVLVAAGDTFRAAAGEQLKVWTDRAAGDAGHVEIFDPASVTEPSAVAYQALELARSQNYDIVIIDTAGRLHTQKNLMEELKKMKRVLLKLDSLAPHETLLVLDANSGQNALIQAREFHAALAVTGIVLTKLDGSAKGGVAVGLVNEISVPIKLIGVGEKIGDLRSFDSKTFVESII